MRRLRSRQPTRPFHRNVRFQRKLQTAIRTFHRNGHDGYRERGVDTRPDANHGTVKNAPWTPSRRITTTTIYARYYISFPENGGKKKSSFVCVCGEIINKKNTKVTGRRPSILYCAFFPDHENGHGSARPCHGNVRRRSALLFTSPADTGDRRSVTGFRNYPCRPSDN